MAFTYKLPKFEADAAAVLDTPNAGTDNDLAQGVLTLLNEAGDDALVVKMGEITGWKYDDYAAGTANEIDVDFTTATLLANSVYSISLKLPYLVNFFGGGAHATADAQQSDAIYTSRTYKVYTGAAPIGANFAEDVANAMRDAINADLYAAFSATAAAGVLTVTADSASAGAFISNVSNAPGATVSDATPWVSPLGTPDEVKDYVSSDLVSGAGYDRYVIEYNKFIRHNAVKGLEVVKPAIFVLFVDKDNAGNATFVAGLTAMLDGSHTPPADYLGAPSM